ncbi:nucleic acid binding protein [Blueberry green mosaic associated virus]|uniref:Nucleic acid binding protein n=1 Tax=Blueberry green mosaic associated virus TaxID=2605718 RepID=A0AAE6IQD6_9VIRU|nr:nucleic acid binding protein [Blueberry green mosaic associated virus]QEH60477.1 nucleic acid binding protein [Blueberry green mosaic associated virus]
MGEPFLGESKSSAKRRAIRHGLCIRCAKLIHIGECKKNMTNSQYQVQEYLLRGPNRFRTERPYTCSVDYLHSRDCDLAGVEYYRNKVFEYHSGNGTKIKSPEETPEFYSW